MRVNFIIPFINWTGGLRIVFEYAEGLHQRGHDTAIYFPLVPYRLGDRLTTVRGLRRWVGDLSLNARRRSNQPWFNLSVPLHMVPLIRDQWVRDADATIATAWPTAYSVAALSQTKGAKFYLVQHHETWSGAQTAVDGSYRLPLHKITIASWLSRLMEERFGSPALDTIINGVNMELFYPETGNATKQQGQSVLMQYSPLAWKGVADGLQAWRIVRQQCPDARLVMFGLQRDKDVPPEVTFHENPPQDALRHLYCASDLFVSTSWAEGCQLPPMEAMACGTAVVATNVGGIPDYAIAGQTALVVEPHDVEGMAAAIIRLLRNDREREQIAQAGYHHIKGFTWHAAVDRFAAALRQGIETEAESDSAAQHSDRSR